MAKEIIREVRIFVRLTEEEKAAWIEAAKAQNLDLSKFVRETVNEKIKKP